MGLPGIIYQGSVKNINGLEGDAAYVFEYSDRYSIFDWGVMPDELAGKGVALAYMGELFFKLLGDPAIWREWVITPAMRDDSSVDGVLLEKFRQHGVAHHCQGLVDHTGKKVAPEKLSAFLAVDAQTVLRPSSKTVNAELLWDYSAYQKKPTKTLVPLEVIFRFGIPSGSSLLERAEDSAYCKELGLTTPPKEGDEYETPIIEYSTKLETRDRYIGLQESQSIAGLNDAELKLLRDTVTLVALRLKDIFAEVGIEMCDGKLELAFSENFDTQGNRHFVLVDSIGPDELRLTYENAPLSKQVLRNFYDNSSWYKATKKAKALAKDRGKKDWKRICMDELKMTPPNLDPKIIASVAMMYKTLSNTLSLKHEDREVFPDCLQLKEMALELKQLETRL